LCYALFFCVWIYSTTAEGQIFVDLNATGANNGTSWANAYTDLQSALADPNLGSLQDQIWIAKGIYTPPALDGRYSSYQLTISGIAIYGGFAGTESIIEEREILNNPTILTGDIGLSGNPSDNLYHVIYLDNIVQATLDGLTIRDGNANGADLSGKGGAILISSQYDYSISVRNCIFKNNIAEFGGAIAQVVNHSGLGQSPNATLNLDNTIFSSNNALASGGAVIIENFLPGTMGNNQTFLNIRQCTFSQNTASVTGAVIFAINDEITPASGTIAISSANSIYTQNNVSGMENTFDYNAGTGTITFNSDHDLFSGNGDNIILNSMLNMDPLLNNDLSLQKNSPAINAGNNNLINGISGTLLIKDITGKPRIRQSTVDLGAFEYVKKAEVRINEFNANVANGCDLAEIRVISGGTMNGISLINGSASVLTFSDFEVSTNQLIVAHFNNSGPCNINNSGNEVDSVNQFSNSNFTSNYDQAFDWYTNYPGLDITDLVLTLTNDFGAITDAVLATDADGATITSIENSAALVALAGEWEMAGGGIPPSGFIDADFETHAVANLTNSGSMQRISDQDLNNVDDWMGNQTETFGMLNTGQNLTYNNPPSLLGEIFAIPENSSAGTIVGQLKGYDPDYDYLNYQITGGTGLGLFYVGPFGILKVANGAILDYEIQSFYTLTITVTDYAVNPLSASATFYVNLIDINEAPSFIGGSLQNILEDAGPQLIPGWASGIVDGDANNQNLQFVLNIPDPQFFEVLPTIDPITGDLNYTVAPNKNGNAKVEIILRDDGGSANGGVDSSGVQYLDISVQAVNDYPTFVATTAISVLEDSGANSIPDVITAITDGDEGTQIVSLIMNNINPSLYDIQPQIDLSTGTLTFTPSPNANGQDTLYVVLKDNGGIAFGGLDTSPVQKIILDILAVNDAPVFTKGQDVSLMMNSSTQTISDWITGLDDGDPEVNQILVFNLSNDNPNLFIIQPAIYNNNTLIFTPAPGTYGIATVSIMVMDNGGTANGGIDKSSTQTFTITISGINHAPSFSPGPDLIINEDSGPQTFSGWAKNISDGDGGNQKVNFLVSNDNIALFQSSPAISPDGTLTFETAKDRSGSSFIYITLQDDGGTLNGGVDASAQQIIELVVNPVNDPPVFNFTNLIQLQEDFGAKSLWAIPDTPPSDEVSQTTRYSISPDPTTVSFIQVTLDENTGQIDLTSVQDSSGTVAFTLTADDGQTENSSYSLQFVVEILPSNDPPVVMVPLSNVLVLQDSTTSYSLPSGLFFDTEDGYNLTLEARLSNGYPLPGWIIFNSLTKEFTISPTVNEAGDYTVLLVASDKEGALANTNFQIKVFLISAMSESESEFIIYPVPVKNEVILKTPQVVTGKLLVKILNDQGFAVKSFNLENRDRYGEITLDLTDLPSGIYFLVAIDGAQRWIKKFIKE